jgi:hypothetical protein
LPFLASNIKPIKELFPPNWCDCWLFSPDNIEQVDYLLKSHLKTDFRSCSEYMKLVEWCKTYYAEDKRFKEFLEILEG